MSKEIREGSNDDGRRRGFKTVASLDGGLSSSPMPT